MDDLITAEAARLSDPVSTLAWLNEPPAARPPKRFAADRGQVLYRQWMQTGTQHRRLSYLVGAACEISTCGATEPAIALVFDHCHIHGWIRAVLCNGHNVRIAHLEAAWRDYGIDLSGTPYWPILMGCHGCEAGYPSRSTTVPKYERVMNDLRRRIATGELPPGSAHDRLGVTDG